MMLRKAIGLMCAGLLLGAAGTAWAGHSWTGASTDNALWGNADNWDKTWSPFTTDTCLINAGSPQNGPQVLWDQWWQDNYGKQGSSKITLGKNANPVSMLIDNSDPVGGEGTFWVGVRGGTQAELIMADTSVASATLTHNSGYTDISVTLRVGNLGPAVLNMNGGTIDIQSALTVPHNIGEPGTSNEMSQGDVYLYGGLIKCRDFQMKSLYGKGYIDITEGTLEFKNTKDGSGTSASGLDAMAMAQTWIDAGSIEGYGGAGEVLMSFDEPSGVITMWATPEPATLMLLGLGGLALLRRKR